MPQLMQIAWLDHNGATGEATDQDILAPDCNPDPSQAK